MNFTYIYIYLVQRCKNSAFLKRNQLKYKILYGKINIKSTDLKIRMFIMLMLSVYFFVLAAFLTIDFFDVSIVIELCEAFFH